MIEKSIFTIAEVAEMFDVNESKIRYYMERFNINVPKKANRLAFSQKHINRVKKVIHLTDEKGFKLKVVKENLRKSDEEDAYLQEVLTKLNHTKVLLELLRQRLR